VQHQTERARSASADGNPVAAAISSTDKTVDSKSSRARSTRIWSSQRGATPDLFTEATRQRPLAAAGVGGKIDQAKRFAKPVKGPGSRRRKADP
jgi:hypothetical protein